MDKFELHNGDCLDVMRGMPENSVDSIVTAPPYGLSFMRGDVTGYREKMRELGALLVAKILPQLCAETAKDICVICTVEDADFLARGVIEELESKKLDGKTRMLCMWNKRVTCGGISIAPVLRSYEEDFDKNDVVFIVVKSIISGACIVKTNLTRAINSANPRRIFVMSPVMLQGAERRLADEFPNDISKKFEFIHFATDTETNQDGAEVIPGTGGSVYELLGLGDGVAKNRYVPDIVKERRRKAFSLLQAAS